MDGDLEEVSLRLRSAVPCSTAAVLGSDAFVDIVATDESDDNEADRLLFLLGRFRYPSCSASYIFPSTCVGSEACFAKLESLY